MLEACMIAENEKEALKEYLQEPFTMDCLLSEGYHQEATFRRQNIPLRMESAEQLEKYIRNILSLYSLAVKQVENEKQKQEVYALLKKEEAKELLLRGETKEFLKVSTIPPTVPTETEMLLSITTEETIPYVSLLGEGYQHEILLPPYYAITEEEKTNSKKGNHKKVKITRPLIKRLSPNILKEYRKKIFQIFNPIQNVFYKIGVEPLSKEEILLYTNWKREVITYIKSEMKRKKEMV